MLFLECIEIVQEQLSVTEELTFPANWREPRYLNRPNSHFSRNLVWYANRWLRRHPDIQVKGAETIELSGEAAPDVTHTASSRHHAAKYQHSRFWALRYLQKIHKHNMICMPFENRAAFA